MTDIDLDTCLQLISDRQRRCVLQHVRNRPTESIGVDELVETVALAERDDEVEPALDEERIAVQLSHSHLPKFAEHGLIDYDPDSGTVRYQPDEQVESLLDSFPEEVLSVSSGSPTRNQSR